MTQNHITALEDLINQRKSTYPKDYTAENISDEILEKILQSADKAPNHKKTKPWRFIVFSGEQKVDLALELQEIYKNTTPESLFLEKKYTDFGYKINKANKIISIIVEFSGLVPQWEEIAATAMAVQNMYLTCTAHKIGCYWSSHTLIAQLSKNLQLTENQQCLGLFYMGKIE